MSISQNFPGVAPSLNLNFVRSKKLDPRITFTRTSAATRINSNGLVQLVEANVPRFDHSYNATTASINSLGLLLEEDRTNILLRSEEFENNAVWATDNSGLTITANSVISPDGTQDAETLVEANTNTEHNRYQGVGLVSTSNPHTFSVFIKPNTVTRVRLGFGYAGIGGGGSAIFNLSTGTVISATASSSDPGSGISASIIPYVNGWYRCIFTVTPSRSDLIYYASIALLNSSNNSFYVGNTANNLYVWGAQLEIGRFATSYIPTTASTVTRTADYASITGSNFSSWFNAIEGTSMITYDKFYAPSQFDLPKYPTLFCFNGWPTRITHADYGDIYQEMNVVISTTFVAQLTGSGSRPVNTPLKFIGSYKENDFAAIGTDRILNTDTSGAVPPGLNAAFIGNENLASSSILNGHIMQILYYPKRLTNTQLVNLTR